ncbi:chymotrypsin-like protease CTRL-1 isoform X2 [Trichoplusia ni]|uniref:Chymotrypsin-like protease CTRL-1 isoform X2 n=1 Tax=Trichoplusia ni TaxID=7111 RepID=A0A7E5W7T6_TRINI|nr:chymotrypsin-like protease CTRL-1 isoform X2 [Trichoplusia ni]
MVTKNVNETEGLSEGCQQDGRRHVIALNEHHLHNSSMLVAERFPYVAAITRNASTLWPFSCFACVVLSRWIVTAAHCRHSGSHHRVILFHDFAFNQSYTFPIQLWRIHEKYNTSHPSPKYDIAAARLNLDEYPYVLKPAVFDESEAIHVEASIWKTVSTMDKRLYLTNHFERYYLKIVNSDRCFETFGIVLDESLICVDMSNYDSCFVHEFGPIFSEEKLVGILAVKPQDCDTKLSIFTNISYYTNWILRTTHEG